MMTPSAVRLFGASLGLAVLAACGGASSEKVLERPTGERRIDCEAWRETLPYEAVFAPGPASNPVDNLMVTFTSRPTSADAERTLRSCIQAAAAAVRIDTEMLITAWHNDDGPLPLTDGSLHLSYDPNARKIQTWNEREGVQPTRTQRAGYRVVQEEGKTAVRPFIKYVTLDVLFEKPRADAEVRRILVTEVLAVVRLQGTKLDTTAYAKSGPADDPAAQEQIRGRGGKYLSVEFDSKSGQVLDQDGRVLQTLH